MEKTVVMLAILVLTSVSLTLGAEAMIYNTKKSSIMPISSLNFEAQVNKIRQTTKQVTIIHFLRKNDNFSQNFAPEFDQFVKDYLGVFKLGFCDCDENPKLCEKEKIQQFPTFRIYPPMPVPAIDVEGSVTKETILQQASKMLQSNVIEVTSSNSNTFINDSPSVPKVFLFTDKKGTPMIYKGLSVAFEGKLLFGIVRNTEDILIERYNIKKFPTILVLKATEKKPNVYKGEMKFQPIFEYLNIYSEVFVPGGGSSTESAATKSWLTEVVPEMTELSANDICLKQEGVLCVIALSKGKPTKEVVDTLKTLNSMYDRKIERGLEYRFMWLDCQIEAAWAQLFQVNHENKNEAKVAILNPGKRKRYVMHLDEISVQALKLTFEKINGGDAKFQLIQGKLPDLSFRKK